MFPPMLVAAVVGGTASCLNLVHHYRQQLGAMSVQDARRLASQKPTRIAEAQDGFVKLVGTVGAATSFVSYYHRVPCALLELHHYEVIDSASGPRRVLVQKESKSQGFWIEDDSGRIEIDPTTVRIDYEVEGGDLDSTIEEHRIRMGERVVLLGNVRRSAPQLTQPMRQASTNFDRGLELVGRPLVTWRSEPEVYPRLLPPVGGIALSAGSIGMAVIGTLLNL